MEDVDKMLKEKSEHGLLESAIKMQIEQLKVLMDLKYTLNQISDLLEDINSKLGQD